MLALAAPALAVLVPAPAEASVSLAVTWDGLIGESTGAAIATAVESRPVWEGGRIYTYTRVRVERSVAGALSAGPEGLWVRTMGGIVGDIGQQVEGEAVLAPGAPSLLFLHPGPTGAFEVTARGQGQFPIVTTPSQAPRVVRNGSMGLLLPRRVPVPLLPPRLAADVLHNRTVDDAVREVADAWSRVHGP
jgi:hypothetical protein